MILKGPGFAYYFLHAGFILWVSMGFIVPAATIGCRSDMFDQPRLKPYASSNFYSDKLSARLPVEGTVPRGMARVDSLLYFGKENGKPAARFPSPITRAML